VVQGEKLFLMVVNVLGHLKGIDGLTSYFICEAGVDVSGMAQ
jgi:hypothetical protein